MRGNLSRLTLSARLSGFVVVTLRAAVTPVRAWGKPTGTPATPPSPPQVASASARQDALRTDPCQAPLPPRPGPGGRLAAARPPSASARLPRPRAAATCRGRPVRRRRARHPRRCLLPRPATAAAPGSDRRAVLRPVVALGRTGPRAASWPAPPGPGPQPPVPHFAPSAEGAGAGAEACQTARPPPTRRAAPPGPAGALLPPAPPRPRPGPRHTYGGRNTAA